MASADLIAHGTWMNVSAWRGVELGIRAHVGDELPGGIKMALIKAGVQLV